MIINALINGGWCLRILLIATCLGPTRKSAQFGLTLHAKYNLLIMLIMTVGVKKKCKIYRNCLYS